MGLVARMAISTFAVEKSEDYSYTHVSKLWLKELRQCEQMDPVFRLERTNPDTDKYQKDSREGHEEYVGTRYKLSSFSLY